MKTTWVLAKQHEVRREKGRWGETFTAIHAGRGFIHRFPRGVHEVPRYGPFHPRVLHAYPRKIGDFRASSRLGWLEFGVVEKDCGVLSTLLHVRLFLGDFNDVPVEGGWLVGSA
jgi:hypothetical protein